MAFTNVRGRTQSSLADINVTPFVDVVLVLLIIFMVTAPVLQSGMDPPRIPTATPARSPTSDQHNVNEGGYVDVGQRKSGCGLRRLVKAISAAPRVRERSAQRDARISFINSQAEVGPAGADSRCCCMNVL